MLDYSTIKEWIQDRSPWIYGILAASLCDITAILMLLIAGRFPLLVCFLVGVVFLLLLLLAWYLFNEEERSYKTILGWIICAVVAVVGIYLSINIAMVSSSRRVYPEDKPAKENSAALYVLKSSPLKDSKDFSKRKIGILKNENEAVSKAMKDWVKNQGEDVEILEYNSSEQMAKDLRGVVIDGAILQEGHIDQVENYKGLDYFHTEITPIHEQEIAELKDQKLQKPMNLLISLTEQYTQPSELQSADLNAVLTIDPNDKNILLTLIPGRYYVDTECEQACDYTTDSTMALIGSQSVQGLQSTVENMLHTKLDGVVLTSFYGLQQLTDQLGGLPAYNEAEFGAGSQYFPAGEIVIQGWQVPSLLQKVWNGYENTTSMPLNTLRLIQAMQKAFVQTGSPQQALSLVDENTVTTLSPEQAKTIMEALATSPDQWNYFVNELRGQQTTAVVEPLGYAIQVIKGTPAMQQQAASSIQAILNGELPEYTMN